MSLESNIIQRVTKARQTILEIAENRNFQIDEYKNVSINEIEVMYKNDQLDMVLQTSDTIPKKMYIRHELSGQIRADAIKKIIEDVFISNMPDGTTPLLANKELDTLVIIINAEPNANICNFVISQWEQFGYFIVIYNIARLQFNILKHNLVPPTKVLTNTELDEIIVKYKLGIYREQLPSVSRFDPLALATLLRPNEVQEISRNSTTSVVCKVYRVCLNVTLKK